MRVQSFFFFFFPLPPRPHPHHPPILPLVDCPVRGRERRRCPSAAVRRDGTILAEGERRHRLDSARTRLGSSPRLCTSDCQFSFKVYFYEKQEENLGLPKMSKKLIYG